ARRGARQGHHRRRRVQRHRHGARSARPHVRTRDRADDPARHRVRPATALRRRLARQSARPPRRAPPTDQPRRAPATRPRPWRPPMNTQPLATAPRARMRAAWAAELDAARAARSTGDTSAEWTHLERAHILSQPLAGAHVRTHLAMFVVAFRRRDRRELVGQLFRIIVAAPGSITGKYPVGNTGGADVSPFVPMPIPDDLRPLLPNSLEQS